MSSVYTQISPLRKRVIRIHVPFLSRRSHTLLYICMWKVDYGCIDLVPPTPPLFNLFLSGGTIMSSQKGKKSRLPGTQKYLFPSHHARGSYNNVSAPYKIATLPPIQICMGGGHSNSCPVSGAEFLRPEI